MEIRRATADDLAAIVAIYNHYVMHSFATFDETPVSVEDRQSWFDTFGSNGPYRLVVADDGEVQGYACSSPFRPHGAFAETVELSIYLAPPWTGRGLGRMLYETLIDDLALEQVHRLVAGIALPNDASVELHRRCGFVDVGVFDEYATKRGRYFSSVWMQRALRTSDD
ncbi:MAG TPA: GNAT family N-acetyltransferase [Ilumatobacteraceae bacterium]|nr:GNAT family N-acetyltransferase [Ilumatobacteraceae bacterium]